MKLQHSRRSEWLSSELFHTTNGNTSAEQLPAYAAFARLTAGHCNGPVSLPRYSAWAFLGKAVVFRGVHVVTAFAEAFSSVAPPRLSLGVSVALCFEFPELQLQFSVRVSLKLRPQNC
jgi:hypothetical protein